jgi:hypothetical protein
MKGCYVANKWVDIIIQRKGGFSIELRAGDCETAVK